MSAKLSWSVVSILALMLLLAACQPIQPAQPAASVGESAVLPSAGQANFVAAGEIAPGQVISGTLPAASADESAPNYWHFMGEAGRRYEVTFTPLDKSLDMVGDVVDASGASVIYGEHNTLGDAEPELAPFTLAEGGDYYLVVRSLSGESGPYRIQLKMYAQ